MRSTLRLALESAPVLRQPARWRLRMLTGPGLPGAELHAEPSRCPNEDPIGRGRAIAGGAALRNLELAVAGLGHGPIVRLLPDAADPLHLATVTAGDVLDPDPIEHRLHRVMPHRRCHPAPFAARAVEPAVTRWLRHAASRCGVRALPLDGEPLRTVGTVLAAALNHRRADEDHLADVERWLTTDRATDCANGSRTPRADRAAIIEQLQRGTLILVTTDADEPPDWLRAGWAVQNALLTAASAGLAASVVGGVLDAPGVRAALALRLRLNGCPQVLLRAGWPPTGPWLPPMGRC